VVIDPKTAGSDPQKIGDLLKNAANDAGKQVNARLKEEIGKMTGGLGLPGMF
jgi:DNA-binding protein YbaB